MGLIKKITVLIICSIIIPFILLFVLLFDFNRQAIINAADTEIKADLSSLITAMDETLDKMESTINSLNYQQEFIYFLDASNQVSDYEKEVFTLELVRSWGNIQQMMPDIFHQLTIYSENESITDIQNADFTIRSLDEFSGYTGLLPENNIRYGIPQLIYNEEEVKEMEQYNLSDEIKMSVPIYYYVRSVPEYETIGIIELKVYVDVLLETTEMNTEFEEGETQLPYAVLLDSSGHMVYPTVNSVYNAVVNVASSLSEQPQTVEINGAKYRAISNTCSRTGLKQVILMPMGSLLDASILSLTLYGLIGILGMGFIILIIKVVVGRVLNRLVVLDKALVTMGDGRLSMLEEDDIEDEVSSIKKHFNTMTLELEEAIQQTIQKENAVKNAELRALQSQISPHFLYNTLNSIRMKLELEEQEELGSIVTSLGDLYKYTIHWQTPVVPMLEEWNHIENYITVMSCRLVDDFFFDLEISEEAKNFCVPKMTLQPIVENSFSHGFKEVEPPWYLCIKAEVIERYLKISISNNGKQIEMDELEALNIRLNEMSLTNNDTQDSGGVGLSNVLQRLHMFNGQDSTIQLRNISDGGVEIELIIGCADEEEEAN
ncbi:MAG: histidine kinase [Eubacteriales bacterium]